MKLVLFAGHRRSIVSCLHCWNLCRHPESPVTLAAVICVSEFSLKQLRTWMRRYGRELPAKIFSAFRLTGANRFDEERAVFEQRARDCMLPSQELATLCRTLKVPIHIVSEINSDDTLGILKKYAPELGLYTGGGILREPVINSFLRGVLNIHAGPLPQIRGMNATEWSLLCGLQPTSTLHFINKGIDTGPILGTRPVSIVKGDSLAVVRARTVLAGMDLLMASLPLLKAGKLTAVPQQPESGLQYFSMSPILKRIVERRLQKDGANLAATGHCSKSE